VAVLSTFFVLNTYSYNFYFQLVSCEEDTSWEEGEGCAAPLITAKKSRNANCFVFPRTKLALNVVVTKISFKNSLSYIKKLNSSLFRVQPQEW
jgi:hypothetical protein